MTDVFNRLLQRVRSLAADPQGVAGEAEGFLFLARENCDVARLLVMTWALTMLRLKRGGAPAPVIRDLCGQLLQLMDAPERFLANTVRVWRERTLPAELAESVYADVQQSREQLSFLRKQVAAALEQVSGGPRIAVDADAVNQAVKKANEGSEWVRLRNAISCNPADRS